MKIQGWPQFSNEEKAIVSEILSSGKVNYWTGFHGKKFEKEFSEFCGSKYSIVMANGSLALSAAYLALGIKNKDEIITTPRTFIATTASACLLKAKPVFADVDLDSGCILANQIENNISENTKAICVVHLAGWPCDMERITKIAKKNKLYLIEDCSQAHGAQINGKSVGSFGDIATWSFCQDKIISTGGEGGMLTTNSIEIYEKVWSFRDHGKSKIGLENARESKEFSFIHKNFGSNFRLTEMQSAIGRIQLSKIDKINQIRTRNANILYEHLCDISCIRVPMPKKILRHAWYKFYGYLNLGLLKKSWNRAKIIKEINNQGYPAFSGSCSEIYLEDCFTSKNLGPKNRLINSKILGETSLMFLVHNSILEEQMNYYALAIRKVLLKANL